MEEQMKEKVNFVVKDEENVCAKRFGRLRSCRLDSVALLEKPNAMALTIYCRCVILKFLSHQFYAKTIEQPTRADEIGRWNIGRVAAATRVKNI